MGDMMTFPASVDEVMEQYKMTDTKHVYSNGTEYVPIYRMKQWFEHCRHQQFPAADVATVRHGRWNDKGEYAVCTECGGRSGTQYDGVEPIPLMTQFCPNCGAKMDSRLNE